MFIKKPPPVEIGPAKLTIDHFILHLIESDEVFNLTGRGIRAGIRIIAAIERDRDRWYIDLGRDDVPLLQKAAETPSHGYPVMVMQGIGGKEVERFAGRHIIDLIDAIAQASDTLPEAPATEARAAE